MAQASGAARGSAWERFIGGYRTPPAGVPYPGVLRHDPEEGWRAGFGMCAGFVCYVLVIASLPTMLISAAWPLVGRDQPYEAYVADAHAYLHPAGMAATNLALGCLVLLSWFLVAGIHRTRPRWLASVGPRVRWRYMMVCAMVALVLFNAMQVLSWAATGTVVELSPQEGFVPFMVVVALTTWVQATGEEYFFRGYLMQALGSLAATPWFGVVASAVVFAFFHGTQNLPLFLNRLGFGLVVGVLVWRTGGLEAGIAGHVVNNVFAYFWAAMTTGVAATRTLTEMGWLEAGIGVGVYVAYALVAWAIARAMKLRVHTPAHGTPAPAATGAP